MIVRLIIEKVEWLAGDAKLISFTGASSAGLRCRAGQYLTFLADESDPTIRRSYSIASSPELGETLAIGVRRIENGLYSRYLVDRAKEGDVLLCTGAGGLFTLPDHADDKDLFFFAAGSGIVPVFSLIRTAVQKHHAKLVLVYSNRSEESTMLREELAALQGQFSEKLRIVWLFGNRQNLLEARLHPTLLEQIVLENGGKQYASQLFYLCGPEPYMRLVAYTLRRMNVPSLLIRREIFNSSRLPPPLLPPDQEPHEVEIGLGSERVRLVVQYPQTILQAALKRGIDLPYSCAAGRCGNCVAKCVSGKVWMSYNEVLTDSDLEQGSVLTCTGHPVGGDLKLVFSQPGTSIAGSI